MDVNDVMNRYNINKLNKNQLTLIYETNKKRNIILSKMFLLILLNLFIHNYFLNFIIFTICIILLIKFLYSIRIFKKKLFMLK